MSLLLLLWDKIRQLGGPYVPPVIIPIQLTLAPRGHALTLFSRSSLLHLETRSGMLTIPGRDQDLHLGSRPFDVTVKDR